MSEAPPNLVWVHLKSTFDEGSDTNKFFGSRFPNGWLIWNHYNQTLAFVPDAPPSAAPVVTE